MDQVSYINSKSKIWKVKLNMNDWSKVPKKKPKSFVGFLLWLEDIICSVLMKKYKFVYYYYFDRCYINSNSV